MSKLFLATSFSGHVNYETGQIEASHRKKVEEVLNSLRTVGGFTVFCAAEHEGWVLGDEPPEVGVAYDLDQIDQSDLVLALLPPDVISAGLQYELGYADGTRKKAIAATEAGSKLDYFSTGAVNLDRLVHVEWATPLELAEQVRDLA